MAHHGDFSQAVYGAVNLGGDTDSVASIVAAMEVCAQPGEITLPADSQLLQEHERLAQVSHQLADMALGAVR